jgi:Tfp pilus assembly protein PilN
MVPLKFSLASLRKWAAFGTGAGIFIGGHDLEVVLVRVRPDGPRVIDTTRIENFRNRPATEWGAEYASFLARNQAKHVAALALLPRDQVILRLVPLPGVRNDDAAAAIGFQLDSLHPFPDDEVVHDWRRIGNTSDFLVAIAEKRILDSVTALFAEAGVKLNGISLSAGAIYPALRLYHPPDTAGFLAVREDAAGTEVYGESPARAMLSVLAENSDRAVTTALSELRLAPETEAVDLWQILPGPLPLRTAPKANTEAAAAESNTEIEDAAPDPMEAPLAAAPPVLAYTAALASSCPHLGTTLNLLPADQRQGVSRARYIPTIALATLLALTLATFAVQGSWQERRYLSLLKAEIAKIEPKARSVEPLEHQIDDTSARARQLDEFRRRTRADLDLLLELTRLLKAPTYLTGLDMNRTTIVISGDAEQAEGLLKLLDNSPLLQGSEFTTPIAKEGQKDVFRIRSTREARR